MRKLLVFIAVAAIFLAGRKTARAELIVGVTVQNLLISFDSATPGTISTIGPITGLTAGDTLVGIDRRPQALGGMAIPGPNNGRIYGLGVNTGTGTAQHLHAQRIDGGGDPDLDAGRRSRRHDRAVSVHHRAGNVVWRRFQPDSGPLARNEQHGAEFANERG